ncbi:hypothetical protein [Gloeothece citriformis]|nr:hypothetical protein [Gloeothece citriformis]
MYVITENQVALETIKEGLPVVPFWCDRIRQRLWKNLNRTIKSE